MNEINNQLLAKEIGRWLDFGEFNLDSVTWKPDTNRKLDFYFK